MKSLLVDALRQAQDGTDSTASPAGGDEHSAPATPGDVSTVVLQDPKLNLLETGKLDASDSAPTEDVLTEAAAEAESQPIRQSGNGRAKDERTLPVVRKLSAIARLGRLTPALCIIALSSGALAFLTYQRIAVVTLNDDLTGVSDLARRDFAIGSADSDWQDLSTHNALFELAIEPPNETKLRAEAENLSAAGNRRIAVESVPGQDATVGGGGKDIRISTTSPDVSAINDRAFAHVSAGFTAYRDGQYSIAERHYNNALDIAPNHRDALAGLAAVYQKTSRTEKALGIYERLLVIDPKDTIAVSAILLIRSRSAGDNIESEIKHLLQRFPEAPHLHFALGKYYVDLSRWPEARLAFLAAHILAPDYADYSYNLAVSMERVGQFESARYYYEVALATIDEFSSIDSIAIHSHLENLASNNGESS